MDLAARKGQEQFGRADTGLVQATYADEDHLAILLEGQLNSLTQGDPERIIPLARTEQAVRDERSAEGCPPGP